MLGADVVMAEATRLVNCEFDDFLRARSEPNFAENSAVSAADNELHRGANLVQLDAQVGQHLGSNPIALADEAEQNVLGANVVVVEPVSLFLRKRQDAARPLGELIKSVGHQLLPISLYGEGAYATIRRMRDPRLHSDWLHHHCLRCRVLL